MFNTSETGRFLSVSFRREMGNFISSEIPRERMRVNILWVIGATILLALPAIGKFWFPFDEGITLACSDMVYRGAVPYKDFITPYGPLQYFQLAAIFRIFSPSLNLAHLYLVICHTIICTIVFYLVYMLSKNKIVSLFVWIVTMSCIILRIGGSASSMYPFLVSGAISILFFFWFFEKNKIQDLILCGFFSGSVFLSRFEMGLLIGVVGIMILCVVYFIQKTRTVPDVRSVSLKHVLIYAISFSFLPIMLLAYFWRENAIYDLLNCVTVSRHLILKYSLSPLPPPCLNPIQIFYGGLHFIQVNQHYISIIVYVTTALILIRRYIINKIDIYCLWAIIVFFMGVSILPYGMYRVSVMHTMVIIFPALILFGFIFREGIRKNNRMSSYKFFVKGVTIFIAFLLVLLAIKNYDKARQSVITKPLRGRSVLLRTDRGNIYMSEKEKEVVENLIKYVRDNTKKDEKIYIGFDDHSAIFQGGWPMLYFLMDRQPSTKYFIALPGIMSKEYVQREIISSLRDVRLIILDENKLITGSAKHIVGSHLLDEYIRDNYDVVKKIGTFEILKNK
jgi:hypothetical protein